MVTAAEESIGKLSEKCCPICESTAFAPTQDTFDLGEVLRRWEREDGVTFTDSVWAEYTRPQAPRITLYRCATCAFASFEPAFAGSADFYKCITTADGSCYTPDKWEFQQAIKDLRKYGCQRVFDIGSGSGYFLDLLRQRLPQVERVGFEFNQGMAQLAMSRGHKMYFGTSPEVILAKNECFDAVCIFQVLEHVADPVSLIKIAQRCLRPGGLLIVAVPDNAGPVRHFSTALTDLPPHHLSRWRASTFKIGLPAMGFEVLRVAHEPLPSFLWEMYLPVILDHSILPKPIVDALNKNQRLIRVLRRLRLKWLRGVPGHSVYVVARNMIGS